MPAGRVRVDHTGTGRELAGGGTMTTECTIYKCPRCNSVISIEKRAGIADVFLCPVCLEGEIVCRTAQKETDRVASILLGGAGEWVILLPSLEKVSTS